MKETKILNSKKLGWNKEIKSLLWNQLWCQDVALEPSPDGNSPFCIPRGVKALPLFECVAYSMDAVLSHRHFGETAHAPQNVRIA